MLAEQKTEKERKAKEETERLATRKAKEEAERLAHAKASKIKGKREEFVYVILNDGTPLYQSLPTSNNWTAWLEKGSKLYITEPIEEVRQRIGKFGQYIEVLDEKGNEGYVRAATVSFTPTEPSSAAKEKKISGVDGTIEEPRDKAAKKTKRESLTQEPPKKEKLREDQPVATPQTSSSRVGMIVIGLFLCGAAALFVYPRIIGAPAATEPPYYPTEAPAATEPAATVEVVPFSGAYEAASGGGDMLTDRTLTLNTPVGGTLTFWTWYDLEPEFDYGFVEASTDDGATWAPLPGNITVTSDNPNTSDAWANSLVGGQATTDTAITGSSGDWVEATFTLPAASGVWVRFNYYTDGSANGQGWFIDDVSIDDFSDDFEDGTGVNWDLGGWTVTTTPSIEPTEPPATEAPVFVPTPASPFPDIPVEFVFGPQDGNLPHEADDLVEIEYASVSLRDFIVTATFQNPYSSSTGSWNYGFLFRDEYGNNQYRLIISSTNWWSLRNHVDSTEGTTIQEGELPNLDVTDAAFNTIWLYCSGDYGELHVNGEFISSFDLSARQNFGDVSVGTGFYNDSEISGYSTDYFEFTVWEIR